MGGAANLRFGDFPAFAEPGAPIDRVGQLLARGLELFHWREEHVAVPLVAFAGCAEGAEIEIALGDSGEEVVAAGETAHGLEAGLLVEDLDDVDISGGHGAVHCKCYRQERRRGVFYATGEICGRGDSTVTRPSP